MRRDRQGKHLLLACADKTLRLLKLCPVPPSGKGLELADLKAQLATPAAQVSLRHDVTPLLPGWRAVKAWICQGRRLQDALSGDLRWLVCSCTLHADGASSTVCPSRQLWTVPWSCRRSEQAACCTPRSRAACSRRARCGAPTTRAWFPGSAPASRASGPLVPVTCRLQEHALSAVQSDSIQLMYGMKLLLPAACCADCPWGCMSLRRFGGNVAAWHADSRQVLAMWSRG